MDTRESKHRRQDSSIEDATSLEVILINKRVAKYYRFCIVEAFDGSLIESLLSHDGQLFCFKPSDIIEILDKLYPKKYNIVENMKWYFNDTYDREIAEFHYLGSKAVIAVNPSFVYQNFKEAY